MGSLSNLYISQSYQSLIHVGTNNTASTSFNVLEDGLGNSLGISVNTIGEISASGNIYGLNITGSSVNTGSLVTTSSFNSYTSSTDGRLNSIEATTASLITSSSNALYTASFDNSTRNLTFTKGNTTQFSVNIPDVSGSAGTFVTTSSFNAYTASQSTASLVTSITNLNTFTSSQLTINTAIGASTSSLNTFSSSTLTRLTNIESTTASLITSASNGLTTASFNTGTRNLTFTKGDTTTFTVNIPDVSGSTINTGSFVTTSSFNDYTSSQSTASLVTSINNLNTFTQSAQVSINALNSATSSYVTEAESGSFLITASVNLNTITFTKGNNTTFAVTVDTGSSTTTDLTSLNAFTQSQYVSNSFFATTGSNTFVGNQTITGNITAFSASFTYLQTIFESSSVIYSSGSNQFGDELTDIQTLSGSVKVQGSLTVNGTPVQTSSVDISALNSFTSSQLTINSAIGASTSSLNTATASLFTSSSLALVTASVSLNTITFTKGDGTTFPITVNTGSGGGGAAFPYTGSAEISGSLKVIGQVIMSGSYSNPAVVDVNNPSTGYAVTITGKGSMDTALYISGSRLGTGSDIILVGNSRIRYSVFPATNSNDYEVFTIQNNQPARLGIYGYVGTQIGYGYGSNNYHPNQIFISSSNADTNARNFIGFNANPSSYVGTYNYVFEADNAAQGGARTYIKGHLFVSQSFTASLQNGYAWVGNSTGYNTQVTTSSFATAIPTGTISGSQQITSLGFVSSSVTASSLVTASFAGNTLTFTKGDATTFGIVLPDVSGSTINTGSFVTTASFNDYTASQSTASLVTSITELNTFTQSAQISINALNAATSSYVTSAITASSLVTASFSGNTLTFTKGDASTFGIVLPDVSGSTIDTGSFVTTASFNDYTASQSTSSLVTSITQLNTATASLFTSASLSLTTASFAGNTLTFRKGDGTTFGVVIPDVSGSTINTGSFATTGSNAFFGTNTFSGAVAFTGSAPTILSSSFSGSIITNLTDIYTDVSAVQQIVTLTSASYAALLSGSLTNPNTLYIVSGSTAVPDITSLNAFTASQLTINTGYNTFTASTNTSLSNINTATASLFTSASLGLTTASFSGNTLTFTKGNGTTFGIIIPDVSGSSGGFATLGANTFTGSQTISSSLNVSGSANFVGGDVNFTDQGRNINIDVDRTIIKGQKPTLISSSLDIQGSLTASLANGYAWVGDATNHNVLVATSSFGTPIPTGTISGSAQITALGFVSSSVTASSLVTASVSLNTITFTKGDASTFNITVNTGSAGGSTDTGSLMRTGSVAGNVLTFTKGDATTFTLTVATGSGGGGAAFPYTGDAVITGSLGISGSMFGGVIPITVVSSTASIDFSKGNMFTLTLPSASTHIVPTNIRAGQTCNIQITQPTPGTGSVLFSPLVLFAGGADYQATQTGSAVDMLTLVSFNGTNTIAAALKNLS